jgi:hypothetical protein
MPREWARTRCRKDQGGKQIVFPRWHAQNPKPAKATLPEFHEDLSPEAWRAGQ